MFFCLKKELISLVLIYPLIPQSLQAGESEVACSRYKAVEVKPIVRKWCDLKSNVVSVCSPDKRNCGFGFIIGERIGSEGIQNRIFVATAAHILARSQTGDTVPVRLYDRAKRNQHKSKILIIDFEDDIALLEVKMSGKYTWNKNFFSEKFNSPEHGESWVYLGEQGEWNFSVASGYYEETASRIDRRFHSLSGLIIPRGTSGAPIITNDGIIGMAIFQKGESGRDPKGIAVRLLHIRRKLFEYFIKEQESQGSALLRSLIIPGWGQYYRNRNKSATVFFSGSVLIGGRIFYTRARYRNLQEKREAAKILSLIGLAQANQNLVYYSILERLPIESQLTSHAQINNWSLPIFFALYLANLWDATENDGIFHLGFSREEINLSFEFRF